MLGALRHLDPPLASTIARLKMLSFLVCSIDSIKQTITLDEAWNFRISSWKVKN